MSEIGSSTEAAFRRAMHEVYVRALKEADYPAKIFLGMLNDLGPFETAWILLHKQDVSDGYTELWRRGRLDLTLEALVLRREWRSLFTPEELQIARSRLAKYGFQVDEGPPTMAEIAAEVDRRAAGGPLGKLQQLRKRLRGTDAVSARGIFSNLTIKEDFAFHHGGRGELQFNLGFEDLGEGLELRHGLAFSLEPSQTLPDPVGTLLPRIYRFNEFFRVHPDAFPDMRMWHFRDDQRSIDRVPTPIPADLVDTHVFIFVGKRQSAEAPDYALIVRDFERLLSLYEFVQDDSPKFPKAVEESAGLAFRAGHRPRPSQARSSRVEQVLDLQLRHNELQQVLFEILADQHGPERVGTEQLNGPGNLVDVVVRGAQGDSFYEIKTALSARACIRQALAQLLEYSWWPGSGEAKRLIIVGEPPLDPDAGEYLSRLRSHFGLPIEYQQLDINTKTLTPPG